MASVEQSPTAVGTEVYKNLNNELVNQSSFSEPDHETTESPSPSESSPVAIEPQLKRPVGRPRKHPKPVESDVPVAPKRGRGRPKKIRPDEDSLEEVLQPPQEEAESQTEPQTKPQTETAWTQINPKTESNLDHNTASNLTMSTSSGYVTAGNEDHSITPEQEPIPDAEIYVEIDCEDTYEEMEVVLEEETIEDCPMDSELVFDQYSFANNRRFFKEEPGELPDQILEEPLERKPLQARLSTDFSTIGNKTADFQDYANRHETINVEAPFEAGTSLHSVQNNQISAAEVTEPIHQVSPHVYEQMQPEETKQEISNQSQFNLVTSPNVSEALEPSNIPEIEPTPRQLKFLFFVWNEQSELSIQQLLEISQQAGLPINFVIEWLRRRWKNGGMEPGFDGPNNKRAFPLTPSSNNRANDPIERRSIVRKVRPIKKQVTCSSSSELTAEEKIDQTIESVYRQITGKPEKASEDYERNSNSQQEKQQELYVDDSEHFATPTYTEHYVEQLQSSSSATEVELFSADSTIVKCVQPECDRKNKYRWNAPFRQFSKKAEPKKVVSRPPLFLPEAEQLFLPETATTDVSTWTVDHVCDWSKHFMRSDIKEQLRANNVNGHALIQLFQEDCKYWATSGMRSDDIQRLKLFTAKVLNIFNQFNRK